MKSGSLVTTGGTRVTRGNGAIWNQGSSFSMESGSAIDNVVMSTGYGVAVFSREGNNYIDGTISNCKSSSGDYAVINFGGGTSEIGPNAKIFGNTTKHGTIYAVNGAKVTVRGEIYNNTTDARDTWASAIYAADNNQPSYVYIENGAYIHNNSHYLGGITPYGTAIIANNTSQIIMNGGRIDNNTTVSAVMVRQSGQFTMNGGTISGHDIGLHIENRNAIVNGRLILNTGTLTGNETDICIIKSNRGYLNGSYAYLSENIIAQSPTVSSEQIDVLTIFGVQFPYRTLIKTILPDSAMKDLHLGNASSAAITKLNAVPYVSAGVPNAAGEKLLATWFGTSADDNFKLTVKDISAPSGTGDVYACLMPVNADGDALNDGSLYKIVPCEKTLASGKMTVTVDTRGLGNTEGYAFGIFANPAIADKTYTLHYESNGGGEYESKTDIGFNDADLLPSAEPSIEGKRFIGWYQDEALTKECTTDTKYSEIVDNDITKDEATIYAKYEPIVFTVEFDPDGGTPVDPQPVEYGNKAAKPDDPTKDGYTFAGWYLGDDEFNFDTPIKSNIILKAKWQEKTYSVTASDDGNGTASANPASGSTGTEVTITALPNDGFLFYKWEVISGGVTIADPGSATTTFAIGDADVEVKAMFMIMPIGGDYYPVTWDPNGGMLSASTYPFEKTSEKTLQPAYKGTTLEVLAAPTRDGYTFLYWECDGKKYKPGQEFTVGERYLVFTAQWKKNDTPADDQDDKDDKDKKDNRDNKDDSRKNAAADTGDDTNPIPLLVLLFASAGALVVLIYMRRRTDKDS